MIRKSDVTARRRARKAGNHQAVLSAGVAGYATDASDAASRNWPSTWRRIEASVLPHQFLLLPVLIPEIIERPKVPQYPLSLRDAPRGLDDGMRDDFFPGERVLDQVVLDGGRCFRRGGLRDDEQAARGVGEVVAARWLER